MDVKSCLPVELVEALLRLLLLAGFAVTFAV
jgi:hypothetical protein